MKQDNTLKVGILSLGCPRNLVDSENILGRIKDKGYKIVDIDKADVAMVNTCAFIDDAKKESIAAILDLVALKKEGRLKKIIVSGCLSERYKDKLAAEFSGVDAFVGKVSLNHTLERFSLTPRHYAYLKICEGCINHCSYCIIPRIKGKFSSLEPSAILKKIDNFNQQKLSELNIIGQDITGYGIDLSRRTKLSGLLKEIIKHSRNIGWIRLLYLYPNRISDDLLKLMRDEPKVCKYIDLPLQHINSRILRLMRRQTSRTDTLKLLEKIRKVIPGVAIRTSLIVGFPSETDKEFRQLLKFIEEMKFERLGAFIYSREEQTPAYNFKGQVPQKIKAERFDLIMSKQQDISGQINQKFLGQTIQVLVDEQEDSRYLGRSQYDAPEVDGLVYINSKNKLQRGDFVPVKIKDTLEYDLVGEVMA